MKLFRIVSGILAIVPVTLLVMIASEPASYCEITLEELVFLILGAPISLVNLWAWIEPGIIEAYLPSLSHQNS